MHMIDNLGGRLGSFDRLEKELPDGSRWSGYDRALGGGAYFARAGGLGAALPAGFDRREPLDRLGERDRAERLGEVGRVQRAARLDVVLLDAAGEEDRGQVLAARRASA